MITQTVMRMMAVIIIWEDKADDHEDDSSDHVNDHKMIAVTIWTIVRMMAVKGND